MAASFSHRIRRYSSKVDKSMARLSLYIAVCWTLGGISCALAQTTGSNLSLRNSNFFDSFKYIPAISTGAPNPSVSGPIRKSEQQRIADLHTAGNYTQAGIEGLGVLATEQPDDELRLIIANSLAWSGRLNEATATYQTITDETLVNDANVGIANVLRWRGMDHLASPIYREILAQRPDHNDALLGLEMAQRELSPRTTVTLGGNSDSSEFRRGAATINHRWRDESGFNVTEIELNGVRDAQPGVEFAQQDVTFRYQALGAQYKPAVELSAPTGEDRKLYGGLRVWMDDDRVQLDVGLINWGRIANNANAMQLGLSASHIGGIGKRDTEFGNVFGRLDYYNISDGNTVWGTDLRLTSNQRPFGAAVKPFVGLETHKSMFRSANYWSPSEGSGALYLGMQGEWAADEWSAYAAGQTGFALYGDAGTSWSLSGGVSRWMTRDVALSLKLWAMVSTRDSLAYRAQSAYVALEKLWR
jgi:hypothetical protein